MSWPAGRPGETARPVQGGCQNLGRSNANTSRAGRTRTAGDTARSGAHPHEELAAIGLKQRHLLINGILPSIEADNDPLAAAIHEREQTALKNIPATLTVLPRDTVELEPWAWIINTSVAAASVKSPLLRQRAANELSEINAVANQYADRYAVVPLLKDEPVGVERLRALVQTQT
ncbi:hypothetical protein [Nitrosomonas halophila]|uniref:hypothetical protein n=1 Tax=Nitrosomonas halophila TaxID=44576 RepID=UPI0031836FAB